MKKLLHKTGSIIEENQDPYEIIYADSRNEEIHIKLLKNAQFDAQMARWMQDIEYNQLLWSDGVYEILEINSKKSGASYATFMEVIHPEDRPIKEEAQKALPVTKKPIEITYRLQMSDGRIKWINEICSINYDQNGNPIRFYGIIQDITKYKLSEKVFIEKEENYKALINAFPIGIVTFKHKNITFINPEGTRILGAKQANEVIGQSLMKFVPPDSLKNFQKKMTESANGMASSFEEKLIQLNGCVFDAKITPIPIVINDTKAFQVIIQDITVRKKTEQALKKSEEKYRLLAVNLADIIWTINSEGIITYVSPFEENIQGFAAERIIKSKISQFLSPACALSILTEWEEMKSIVQSGVKMGPRKLILDSTSKDEGTKWLEVTNLAIYDSIDNFVGFSGICQNITQKKEAEQIVEENERLHKTELQIKELIATKDKFLAVIAHDLRSPLKSIIGFLDLLNINYDNFNDTERKEHLSLILENSNTLLNLLENLLEWTKSQTGRIAFQPVRQNLMSIFKSINEIFYAAIKHKNIRLQIFISDDIEIFADTNMVISIFQNLISNAIKYSKPEGEIAISVQEIPNQIELIVSDNGIGMSKETINNLFKVGEDISIPGTYNEKGSGLGLILCKDFIDRHHGSISVESEFGKGSKFIIRLPHD